MNLERLFIYLITLECFSAMILLILPRVHYLVKSFFISLLSGFWIYLSINFLTVNFIYIVHDDIGVFFLISFTVGAAVSTISGCVIMALLVERQKTSINSDK